MPIILYLARAGLPRRFGSVSVLSVIVFALILFDIAQGSLRSGYHPAPSPVSFDYVQDTGSQSPSPRFLSLPKEGEGFRVRVKA